MNNPVVIQGIGVVALIVAISVFQTNKRKHMLVLSMGASLLWSGHFLLLGALTGAVMNLLVVIRGYVYYRINPSKKNRWILWFFIGLTALASALTWSGWISILPFIGTANGVISFWQKNPKYIRRLALISPPPWFTYALLVGSYPGMIIEALMFSSNLIGQYRFDFKKFKYRKLLRIGTR